MAGPHLQQPSFLLVGVRAALRRHSLLLQRQERAGPGGQRSRSRCMGAVPVEAPAARAVQPRVSAGMLPRRSGAGGDFLTSWPRQGLSCPAALIGFPLWFVPGHAEGGLCQQTVCAEVPRPGDHHRGAACQGERSLLVENLAAWQVSGELGFILLFLLFLFVLSRQTVWNGLPKEVVKPRGTV